MLRKPTKVTSKNVASNKKSSDKGSFALGLERFHGKLLFIPAFVSQDPPQWWFWKGKVVSRLSGPFPPSFPSSPPMLRSPPSLPPSLHPASSAFSPLSPSLPQPSLSDPKGRSAGIAQIVTISAGRRGGVGCKCAHCVFPRRATSIT